jgi:hypothetical protein
MSRTAVISLSIALCTATALAQNTPPSQQQPTTEVHYSQPRNSSLLARSDMQTPKPIPIVKPLHFQEIPVAIEPNSGQPNTYQPNGENQAPPQDAAEGLPCAWRNADVVGETPPVTLTTPKTRFLP